MPSPRRESAQQRANRKGREALKAAGRKGAGGGAAAPARRFDLRGAAAGLILAALAWQTARSWGLTSIVPLFRYEACTALVPLAGALLGATRARALLWIAGGALVALLFVVGYTPVAVDPLRALIRSDPLRPVEAVVVLASDIYPTGTPMAEAQLRLLRGYEVIRQGYARRLVLTRLFPPRPSYVPAVRRQLAALGIDAPIDETEAVRNTADEARAVKRLAARRGWSTVILVTSPSHTRRAAALFEATGLRVLCAPSATIGYDPASLRHPQERLDAFGDWLYETLGWHWHRLRGRL